MEAQAEVNWSEVCRNAIQVYLENRRSTAPRLSVRIERTSIDYYSTLVTPQLNIQLAVRNLMGREVMVDRILFTSNLVSVKTGNTLFYLDGAYLSKFSLAADGEQIIPCVRPLDYMTMERLIRAVKGSFRAQIAITVFVDGLRQPLIANATATIAIDEWNEAVDKYQKGMAPG
jgi:hypothetical protein